MVFVLTYLHFCFKITKIVYYCYHLSTNTVILLMTNSDMYLFSCKETCLSVFTNEEFIKKKEVLLLWIGQQQQ